MLKLKIFSVAAGLVLLTLPTLGQPPSFRNLVAVGDSLTAGVLNGSLNEKGQQSSYAALVARQAGTFLILPLITEPGVPKELILIDPGPPPVIEETPGPAGTRSFPLVIPQNIAVPGQSVVEAVSVRPDLPLDSLEDLVLGLPSLAIPQLGIPPLTQIETAFALRPTFTLFWLGNNDVLQAVTSGGAIEPTPIEEFQQAYATALGTVLATGSQVVVANAFDVGDLPFLAPAELIALLVGQPLELIGLLLGIGPGDSVTLFGVPLVGEILSGNAAGPLPDDVVFTAEEKALVQASVEAVNGVMAGVAASLGVPLVDVNSVFREARENGILVGGQVLTTNFLGGLFGVDGLHPTMTGQAIIANEFIEAINETFGTSIPLVDVEAVAAADPFVPGEAPSLFALEGLLLADLSIFEGIRAFHASQQPALTGRVGDRRAGMWRSLKRRTESRTFLELPDFVLRPGPIRMPRTSRSSLSRKELSGPNRN